MAMRYHGKEIRPPQSPLYRPKDTYIKWHLREVFRGPKISGGLKMEQRDGACNARANGAAIAHGEEMLSLIRSALD